MFKRRFICHLLIFSFVVLNSSCFFLISPKANQCCNFDPAQNKLVLKCGDASILFVRISVSSMREGVSGTEFFEKGFDPPVNEIILPDIPDSIKQTRDITIDIWESNQVIWDYSIRMTPEKWQSRKLVFARYSYR